MRTAPELQFFANRHNGTLKTRDAGFSLIELLIGMSIMAVALLSIATMFSTGYTDVTTGGKTTMATAAARQMLEDMQSMQNLTFGNIANLHNFDTDNSGTLALLTPGTPEYVLARKWRYALAGPGTGWPVYSYAEQQMWSTLSASGVPLGVRGLVQVTSPTATLREVTVTVFLPGRTATDTVPIRLATLISRL